MGKNGELLRQQKRQNTVYTFTAEQLADRDRTLLEAFKKQVKEEADAIYARREEQAKKVIAAEWEEREKLFSDKNKHETFMVILHFLLATSCRVLIERFHWKPIPKDGIYDRRNRLMRFSDYLVDEVQSILEDDTRDIRTYCDEVRDLYGVEFRMTEVDSDG